MVVGCAPGGGLVGHPPDGMPAPPKEMGSASAWARFLMGFGKQRRERRSRHLGVVGLAVGCAPGWGIVSIPSMERRADTMGSASAWARFSMGFGRRRRERLGVAIMFLNLAHFAPAAGPSRTKSSSPSSPLRTFSMDAEKGNPLLGGAPWGFLPSRPGRLAGHSSGPWRAPSSERLPCSWPAWRLAPPRRRRRVSPPLTALLAQALSCSRSCHSCSDAVAELLLQPSPPSRSPCRHVAVA